jgi:hypothetical protein
MSERVSFVLGYEVAAIPFSSYFSANDKLVFIVGVSLYAEWQHRHSYIYSYNGYKAIDILALAPGPR